MIITQDLEPFHGWGLNMATRRQGTFALEHRQCWPHSSGCLVSDKKKYKLPVKYLHWPYWALSEKSYKVWTKIVFQCFITSSTHINHIIAHKWANIRQQSQPSLYIQLLMFCVCAYSNMWRHLWSQFCPVVKCQSSAVDFLGLNTWGKLLLIIWPQQVT